MIARSGAFSNIVIFVLQDELTKGVFAVEAAADPSLPPTLKVLQALDREANDTFDLNVVATNQCQVCRD